MIKKFDLNKLSGKSILITGGAGFIGGALVRKLLENPSINILNIDKLGYASDLEDIDSFLKNNYQKKYSYKFRKYDLCNKKNTEIALKESDPDLVFHFAAESHVDRSIDNPINFIDSNILGTFNLLESVRAHFNSLNEERKQNFRFHHISTDEVFGSLGENGFFDESTSYDPRSPYSASKAASDHLVRAWFHTYSLPISITNCSNNFGPWQFPEKLIPLVIIKCFNQEKIPVYGDGNYTRDWLYIDDHINGILLAANEGKVGSSYCIGGYGENNNLFVINKICEIFNQLYPKRSCHKNLIEFVVDRPGHDRRYAINSSKIKSDLGWSAEYTFEDGLRKTIEWYLENFEWVKKINYKNKDFAKRRGKI